MKDWRIKGKKSIFDQMFSEDSHTSIRNDKKVITGCAVNGTYFFSFVLLDKKKIVFKIGLN
jgi:hypothetical protein